MKTLKNVAYVACALFVSSTAFGAVGCSDLFDYKDPHYVKAKNDMINTGMVTAEEFNALQDTCLYNQHAMYSPYGGGRVASLEAILEYPNSLVKNSPAAIRTVEPVHNGFYGNDGSFGLFGHNKHARSILSERCFNLVSIIAKRKQMSLEETRKELRTKEEEIAALKEREQRRSLLSRILNRS